MVLIEPEYFVQYQNSLNDLYTVCRKIISDQITEISASNRVEIAVRIIQKVLLHVHSINVLLAVGRNSVYEVDISLIASSARNIMECGNLYFHLTERNLSTDQFHLRDNILTLHQLTNEADICSKLGFSDNCLRNNLQRFSIETIEDLIRASLYFQELDSKSQSFILSGKKPAFQKASPNILSLDIESAIYNLFSNSIHGYPLGLSNNSIDQSFHFRSFFDWSVLVCLAVIISRIYLSNMILDYLNLRKAKYKLITKTELAAIKSCRKHDDLVSVIEKLRQVYAQDWF